MRDTIFADLKGMRISDGVQKAAHTIDWEGMFAKFGEVDIWGTDEPPEPFIGEPSDDPEFDSGNPMGNDSDSETEKEIERVTKKPKKVPRRTEGSDPEGRVRPNAHNETQPKLKKNKNNGLDEMKRGSDKNRENKDPAYNEEMYALKMFQRTAEDTMEGTLIADAGPNGIVWAPH